MAVGFIFDLILVFFRLGVLNIFFREIRPRGAWNIPETGPVLFIAAPHANQFLDPLILTVQARVESGRRTAMLIASKSMERKFIGFIAKMFNAIPVTRAADYAKSGAGRIRISDDDPLLVIGEDTKFTTQVSTPRSQFLLPKSTGYAQAAIAEVISDTEARLVSEFTTPSKDGNSNVKATTRVRGQMKEQDGLTYKILPHVDQEETYGAVFERLNQNGTIGIFPEGGSHDRTDFLPLKAGFAIMALGAMAQNPDLNVQLVPVGLSYFHAHKFRSRAVVEFGNPITVNKEMVDAYKQGGAKKREACGKLLATVHDGLRAVTLRAPDYETLQVIQAARRLYRTPGERLTLGQVVQLSKHFMEGYLHFQHEPRVIDLRERVLKYNRKLRDLGVADHQVERASNRSFHALALLIYRFGLLLWWGLLSLPGGILHAPVFILAKTISHKKAKEALAASTVKVQARDVLATWKVLVSLAVVPTLYIIYTIIALIAAYHYDFAYGYRKWIPVFMFCALPALGYSALKFGEAGMDVAKSLRPLFLSIWPGNQREVQKLKILREDLSNDINDVIAEFGPKLFENFENSRYFPSSKSPKSQTVDTSVLSHPLMWLDERVFGWSRSATGARAWSNASDGSRSVPPTAPGSPRNPGSPRDSDTEEEADVDYDDILSVIDMRRNGANTSPRKRTGRSYSDLKELQAQQASPEVVKSDPLLSVPEVAPGLRKRETFGNEVGGALGLDKGE